MPLQTVMAWLGVTDKAAPEHSPLRDLIASLDRLEPDKAKHLARFAYLLGRVALADRTVGEEETRTMEALVQQFAYLTPDQATMVVGLAKSSNALFGGTADYAVAKEFSDAATYEEKIALAECLFTVAASDNAISLAEETEIHRIVNQLKVLPADLTRLRLRHEHRLPGRANTGPRTDGAR